VRPPLMPSFWQRNTKRRYRAVSKLLTESQVRAYHEAAALLFPHPHVPEKEMAGLRRPASGRWRAAFEARTNQKIHLLVPWLNDLVRHPASSGSENVVRPSIFCWGGLLH